MALDDTTAFLYDYNVLMLAGVATLLFLGARHWLNSCEPGTKYSFVAMFLSSVLAVFAIFHYADYVHDFPVVFERHGALHTAEAVLAAVLLMAVQLDLSRQNTKHFIAKVQTTLTSLCASIWLIQPYFDISEFYVRMLALLAALAFATMHRRRGNRIATGFLTTCSMLMLACSGGDILKTLIHSGWWGLAAAGSAIIVGGAAAERTLSKMKPKPVAGNEAIAAAG